MTASLRQAAGSLLVVGIGGKELTNLERAWLKLVRPAGIILFQQNIENPTQTRALLGEATGLCAAPSFRCVDVEGGAVNRLRDALGPISSAQAVTLAAKRTGKKGLIREQEMCIRDSSPPRPPRSAPPPARPAPRPNPAAPGPPPAPASC